MQPNYQKIIKFATFIFLLYIVFQSFLPITVQAGLWDSQEGMNSNGTIPQAFGHAPGSDPGDIRIIIANIIKVVLTFVGIILVVLLLLAGYNWMTAAGESAKVDKAKTTIRNAVIGIVILTMAFAITQMVVDNIYEISTNL
jgi:hypothetical protein